MPQAQHIRVIEFAIQGAEIATVSLDLNTDIDDTVQGVPGDRVTADEIRGEQNIRAPSGMAVWVVEGSAEWSLTDADRWFKAPAAFDPPRPFRANQGTSAIRFRGAGARIQMTLTYGG